VPTATSKKAHVDIEIAEFVGQFYADPFNFVRCAYPWRQKGPLETYDGPDIWQADLLKEIGREVRSRKFNGTDAVLPVRTAISSGHGVGKSTLSGWLTNWIMSTRPHSQGTVTANTFPQLASKTWPAIAKWTRMCVTAHWFEVGASKIYNKSFPDSWFVTAQTCRAENSEAFHGQHAARSTSWYLFDEASAIPDEIWAAAEGGLTDGEPMIFCFGNPTRNTGKFHRVVFGSERDRWKQRTIDSRDCRFTNKTLIEEWIADWGEDSDFVRVRVRGIAPRAGDLQFIPNDLVWEAQRRLPQSLPDDPLIAGFDVSGGGAAWNVISFRRGYDARSIPAIRIPGEHTKGSDRSAMVAKLAEIMSDTRPEHRVSMLFVDAAFGAPYVERLKSMGFTNVIEVSFGAPSPDRHCANMRAYMWSKMKTWLEHGAINTSTVLEMDLTGPGCDRNRSDKLVLESKQDMLKRGVASPDEADSLALTFAHHVAPPEATDHADRFRNSMAGSWMG